MINLFKNKYWQLIVIYLFLLQACTKDETIQNNSGSVGGGSNKGDVTFWIDSDFGCGPITVSCDGNTETITNYYPSGEPGCNSTGNANFKLDPGTYNFIASCSNRTWSGSVTVTPSGCIKKQLLLSGGSPGGGGLPKVIFWANADYGCGPINVTMQGVTKQITAYVSSAPACGTPGFATFEVPYGILGYTASCTGKTWYGTVSTTPGVCTSVKLSNTSGGGSCSGQISSYGAVSSVSSPANNWGNWYKVANVGNGAVYISFKLNSCNGWPLYRIQNTCTNITNCKMTFRFAYNSCIGGTASSLTPPLPLDASYIMQNSGMWFLGQSVTQTYVPGSVLIN